ITECRRQEYNQQRPHSSLNDQTPEEFIRSLQKGRNH
ncbi:TPA: transposase, partial [Escherichia coli]|nr:transposase [Escherichia coli]